MNVQYSITGDFTRRICPDRHRRSTLRHRLLYLHLDIHGGQGQVLSRFQVQRACLDRRLARYPKGRVPPDLNHHIAVILKDQPVSGR